MSGATAAVQASYGALATNGGCCGSAAAQSSCCSPSSNAMELVEAGQPDIVLWETGYTAGQIALVPAEAANLSLGCGNPTAMASLRPGETVLDIGSGAGIDAFYAARRVGDRGRVIGLDMTPAMIERARRSAEAAGLEQVEFRPGPGGGDAGGRRHRGRDPVELRHQPARRTRARSSRRLSGC